MKKIGIMGGTFDPIHNGHLLLARCAYEEFELERVLVMPSGNPPHKSGHVAASPLVRAQMVKLAIAGIPYLEYSGIECEREGYIYSSDTMEILQRNYPEQEYYFIIGADSLFSLEEWHCPGELLQRCVMVAAIRGTISEDDILRQINHLTSLFGGDIRLLHVPPEDLNLSSHGIRELVQEGKDITGLVPPTVADYIKESGLYDTR